MRIGLLFARSGAASLWGPAIEAAAALAAAEINNAGGVRGREVELIACDCGASPASAARLVDDLIQTFGVEAVVRAHPSDRLAARAPYVYTARY